MSKIQKSLISLAILSLVVLPLAASAFTIPSQPTENNATVNSLVSNVVDSIWMVFAALAVMLFVYAGILFLTAAGSPEKIQAARTAAMWGVVGIVVMVLAYSIFNIATSFLGGGA